MKRRKGGTIFSASFPAKLNVLASAFSAKKMSANYDQSSRQPPKTIGLIILHSFVPKFVHEDEIRPNARNVDYTTRNEFRAEPRFFSFWRSTVTLFSCKISSNRCGRNTNFVSFFVEKKREKIDLFFLLTLFVKILHTSKCCTFSLNQSLRFGT